MLTSNLEDRQLAQASHTHSGIGIAYSATVMVQKRFLVINSSSLLVLILLHIRLLQQPGMLEPAAFRNLACLVEAQ